MMIRLRLSHFVLTFVLLISLLGTAGISVAGPALQANPAALVYGQTVDGFLNSDQPSVDFVFDAQTGDVVTTTMIMTGGEIDPFLVLLDTNQGPLMTDDNSGGGMNARLTFIMPASGRYTIRATHVGGTPSTVGGTYSLNLTVAVKDQGASVNSASDASDMMLSESVDPGLTNGGLLQQGDTVRLLPLAAGDTVRDALDRQVAIRLYWFEALAGDNVVLSPEQFAEFQPLLVLYDGAFNVLAQADPGTGIRMSLATSGVHFVVVSLPHASNTGGSYGFTFNLSANPARSGNFIRIQYGETQRGNLDNSVPGVTYEFQGSEGDAITVSMRRSGGDLNSYLYLLDAEGQLLFEDNDSGLVSGDAQFDYVLPSSGRYLILATRLGQAQGGTSGSYVVELRSDAEPPDVEPTGEDIEVETEEPELPAEYADLPQISYGETVEDVISDENFLDVYVFYGEAGDTVLIEMASLNGEEFNGLDPLLVLLDGERIPLAENDDIVDGQLRDSLLEITLPKVGYYAVVATRFEQEVGTSAGPYTLTLSGPDDIPQSQEVEAQDTGRIADLDTQLLGPGTSVQGTFSPMGQLYTFSASAGALIDLAVTTDQNLDSVLILTDSNLNEILSSGTGTLTGVELAETGRFLVFLAPRFGPVDTTGGYILSLTLSSVVPEEDDQPVSVADAGPRTIAFGETATGVIDDEIVSQLFTFDGVAGDRVRVTMEAAAGSSLDTYVELQDANNAVVAANDDIDPGVIRNSEFETELPSDGVYTIIASRYVGDDAPLTSGAFRLTVIRFEEPVATTGVNPEMTPLAYGRSEVGEISDEQYLVFYVFEGSAGDVVTVDLDTISGNLDSVVYLYQSVGDGWLEIANNDDSATGGTYDPLLNDIVLPQTGKYLIAVGRYGLERENTFGTFTVSLTANQ